MLERPSWRSTDRAEPIDLALWFNGATLPLRLGPLLKCCGALLDGDMAIAADVAQLFQADAAMCGASATCGAAGTMMMRG